MTAPQDQSITSYDVQDRTVYNSPGGTAQEVDVTGSRAYVGPPGTEVTRQTLDPNTSGLIEPPLIKTA
jgi:hypothetical protein